MGDAQHVATGSTLEPDNVPGCARRTQSRRDLFVRARSLIVSVVAPSIMRHGELASTGPRSGGGR
jgi:hypothetical protein